jgi:hypothetical protein
VRTAHVRQDVAPLFLRQEAVASEVMQDVPHGVGVDRRGERREKRELARQILEHLREAFRVVGESIALNAREHPREDLRQCEAHRLWGHNRSFSCENVLARYSLLQPLWRTGRSGAVPAFARGVTLRM